MSNIGEPKILPQDEGLEEVRDKVSSRLITAIKNPISEDRLELLGRKDRGIKEMHVNSSAYKNADMDVIAFDETVGKRVSNEIKCSTAMADNVIEFKIMLEALSKIYGPDLKWVENYLAHENAHAVEAIANDFNFEGYGVTFIKGNSGGLSAIPRIFIEEKPEWTTKESIIKLMKVIEAPKKHGDQLSEDDSKDLAESKKLLNRIDLQEK